MKGVWLQPGEAIGNAAAQSCIFLIDYRHSNMMHSATSVSVLAGVSISPHHATRVVRSYRNPAAAGSVQLIPWLPKFKRKKKDKEKKVKSFSDYIFQLGAPTSACACDCMSGW